MKPHPAFIAGFLMAALAATAQDPNKTKDVLTGDNKRPASANPVCKLFTHAEIAKYLGKPVAQMRNAGLGTGCQWVDKDDEADLLVQVVPARYHEEPKLAKGFTRLPELGPGAFVLPEMGGWKAAALRGEESIVVSVESPVATQASATALLKEALARRK